MAYRNGEEREQMVLFPESLDEYVREDHPVRAYDAFIDGLKFEELGIMEDENRVGNPEYNPRLMMKLLVYGYSYGVKGSRKIEREAHNNVTFMWLLKRLKPDHKTISEFRRKNKQGLQKVMKICARLCLKLGLIEGNILFLDSTKVRANAGRCNNHTEEWCKEQLIKLDEKINRILDDCERIDEEEKTEGSLVKMKEELSKAEVLKEKVRAALEEFREEGRAKTRDGKDKTVNIVDTESALMHSVQGTHASYAMQNVVDDKHGLIVNSDIVSEGTDCNQFSNQIKKAEEVLDKKCEVGCADAGYASTDDLMQINKDGRKVIVPSQRQALHEEEKEFGKSKFKYDKEKNCYYCPEGNVLDYRGECKKKDLLIYKITEPRICRECKNYGVCTRNKEGRGIGRLKNEEEKEMLERQYKEAKSQEIYKRRKERVEHVFGHLKRNLGITQFLLRGREGAKTEAAIGAVCFNITRMITIFGGVQAFINEILQA